MLHELFKVSADSLEAAPHNRGNVLAGNLDITLLRLMVGQHCIDESCKARALTLWEALVVVGGEDAVAPNNDVAGASVAGGYRSEYG